MRKTTTFIISLGTLLLAATVSQGALLNLTQQPPDITSGTILVTYDAGTDAFSAVGTALTYDLDGIAPPDHAITGGGFSLLATIDAAGNPSGGTLSITGTIPALGANSGTLLTGSLQQVGFVDAGGTLFEFTFARTGGDLLASHPGPIGVILDAGTFTSGNGTFASDFSNALQSVPNVGLGVADTFPVPEPATMVLLGVGGGLALLRRRRRA